MTADKPRLPPEHISGKIKPTSPIPPKARETSEEYSKRTQYPTKVQSIASAKVIQPCNLYGCTLMDDVFVGPFCEIQHGVIVGARSRISSHSFICSGVFIAEDVFIGHGVMFTNDLFDSDDIKSWKMNSTVVECGVRIGSNVTVLPVRIGHHSIIGAGSVITKDVPPYSVVIGNPGKVVRTLEH